MYVRTLTRLYYYNYCSFYCECNYQEAIQLEFEMNNTVEILLHINNSYI